MRSHEALVSSVKVHRAASIANIARAAGLIALLGAAGCFATAEGDVEYEADVPVVEVEPPVRVVEVDTYPRYYYRGEYVYLVEGHWYARRGPHWVQYRREPVELSRHRIQYERTRPRHVHRR